MKKTLAPDEYKRFKKWFGFKKVVTGGPERQVKIVRTKSGKKKKVIKYVAVTKTFAYFWNLHTFIDIWKGKKQLTTQEIERRAREKRRWAWADYKDKLKREERDDNHKRASVNSIQQKHKRRGV